jgi:hypothetical protein
MTTPDWTAHNFVDGQAGNTPLTAAKLNDDEAEILALHVAAPTGVAATDTATINTAKAIGAQLQPGTYITNGITINTGDKLIGAGHGATIIKLANSINGDVIVSSNFAANTGTNGDTGPISFIIQSLSVDGNKANNASAGNGIRLFGRDFVLRDLRVYSCTNDGVYTEWGNLSSISGTNNAMECDIDNVKSHNNGGWGFNIHGPHDGFIHHSIGYSNGSGGFNFISNSNGFLANNCHSWGDQPFGAVLGQNSVKWDHSEAETTGTGTNVCILVQANDCSVSGGYVYDPATTAGIIGIKIGDGTHAPINTHIDCEVTGTPGGCINFSNSGGHNWARLLTFIASGTVVTGTPDPTDVVDIPTAYTTAVTPTALGANGVLVRDYVSANYQRHRKMLPDPGGSITWYKLGTWVSTADGSRMTMEIVGTTGYGAGSADVGTTRVVISTGNGASPNIVGYYYAEGGNGLLTGMKAVATGGVATGRTWDIWASISTFTGNSHIKVELGNDTNPATWAWILASGADPGAASSTVAVFTDSFAVEQMQLQTGHIVGQIHLGYSVTVTAGAGAGTSPTVTQPVTCMDSSGTLQVVAGTTPAAGALVTVTFAFPYSATPKAVVVSPGNSATASLNLYVSAVSTTAFTVSCVGTPTAAATYLFRYALIG